MSQNQSYIPTTVGGNNVQNFSFQPSDLKTMIENLLKGPDGMVAQLVTAEVNKTIEAKVEAVRKEFKDEINELKKEVETQSEKIKSLEQKLQGQGQSGSSSGTPAEGVEELRRLVYFILLRMPMLPYRTIEEELLKKVVKKDWSELVKKERVDGSGFVIDQPMKFGDDEGKYTGWWKDGEANGRGTWVQSDGSCRYDAYWLNDVLEEEVQVILPLETEESHPQVQQGKYVNGSMSDGFVGYESNGKVCQWNSNEKIWIDI